MKGDCAIKAEMAFEEKIRAFLGEYGFCLREVIDILDPQAGDCRPALQGQEKPARKVREVKVYKKPQW